MAGGTVTIEGQSDVGSVIAADLQSAQEALGKFESGGEAASASAGGLDKAMGMLGATLGAIGIPLTVAGIIALGAALDTAGGAAIRASNGLDTMTGGQALEWTESMRAATHGLIDDDDAATVATQLLTSGMASSKEEASHFVEVATTLGGAIKDLDAKTASEELANMFSSGNVRAAKDFGLSVIELRDRVKELKDADADLSDQQALIQAFMEQAEPLSAKLAGTLDDEAAAAQRLKTAWDDLGETVGAAESKGLGPAKNTGSAFITMLNDLLNGVDLATKEIQDYNPAAQRQTGVTEEQASAMKRAGLETGMYSDVAKAATDATYKQADANKIVKPTLDDLAKSVQDVDAAMQTMAGHQLIAEQQVGDLTGLWWGAGTASRGTADDIAGLSKDLAGATEALTKQNIAWGDHDTHSAVSQYNLDQTKKKVDDLTQSLDDANQKVSFGAGADMGKIFEFATGQMAGMGLSATEMLDKYNKLGLATGQVTELQVAQGSALTGLNKLYADGKISTETYLEALSHIPAAADEITAKLIAVGAAVKEAKKNMADAGGDEQDITKAGVVAGREAGQATSNEAILAGIKSTIDQINAMPGAQLKVLPDTALQSIANVTTAIDNLAIHGSSTPVPVNTNTVPAEGGVSKVASLLAGIKDKTVTVTVLLDDQTGGAAGGGTPPGGWTGGIVGYAGGTLKFPGGIGMVGEQGREMVHLPAGSHIYNNSETEAMLRSLNNGGGSAQPVMVSQDTYQVTIQAPTGAVLQDLLRQAKLSQAGGG